MTSEVAALAVLLRKTQWLLDDVAYEVAAGRMDEIDLGQVAGVLEGVAKLLRSQGELPALATEDDEVESAEYGS
ncbi:hypothetical protein [Saccharopolyspora mangrovi]|uniref:Uncharacterized protein n=1 Tax=Saccharopolyspora mangrovi TaxID=3082379 RepID=A0ABU6ALJ9_9PSEU|nr:hypothetical protein [Saccharopolyspora sp. S2-29]MEB3372284.1 hypothetical protein [Saccharopolyspora sp. S2-29]